MKINGACTYGIKFEDSNGEELLSWDGGNNCAEWREQSIPEGHVIVGVYGV